MNYEKDMYIDPDSLDVEWLGQPSLVMKYASISAKAELELDQAKERLDLAKAELDTAIRSNPEKYGIMKITEAVVTSTILTQEKYKEVTEEYLQAKFDAKIASGASRAVDHRKSALENLVKLHGQQYFAGPMVPRDLTHEWKSRQQQLKEEEEVDRGVGKSMRRRREE